MPAAVGLIAAILGFGLVAAAGAWLGHDAHAGLAGLFPPQGRSDWPTGVQEGDAPRFALDRVGLPRTRPPEPTTDVPRIYELARHEPVAPPSEVIDLHVRRLAHNR